MPAFNKGRRNNRPTPRSRRFYAHGSFAGARDPRRLGVDGRERLLGCPGKGRQKRRQDQVGLYARAMDRYRLDMKKYPGNLQDLIGQTERCSRGQSLGRAVHETRSPRILGTANTSTCRPASITPIRSTSGPPGPMVRTAPRTTSATGKTVSTFVSCLTRQHDRRAAAA